MIDIHYASLTSQGVQHRVFYRDGHPPRYQPRPTGLNFGEQTGTGVFPLVIAVPIICNMFVSRTSTLIDHFTVVCVVAWPLNESEAGVDLVLIETSQLFLC